jgi:hypothetical protein
MLFITHIYIVLIFFLNLGFLIWLLKTNHLQTRSIITISFKFFEFSFSAKLFYNKIYITINRKLIYNPIHIVNGGGTNEVGDGGQTGRRIEIWTVSAGFRGTLVRK